MNNCDRCGQFVGYHQPGSSYAEIYSFDPGSFGLDREVFRCPSCTLRHGPVHSNARPANHDMSPYQRVYAADALTP